MENQEIIDILKHLSQTHRKQFHERRTLVEWRSFFTVLTFYTLLTLAVLKNEITFPNNWPWLLPLLCGSLAIITVLFLTRVHMAGNKDKRYAERAEDALRELAETDSFKSLDLHTLDKYWVEWKQVRSYGIWGLLWQSTTVVVFSVAATFVIILKN